MSERGDALAVASLAEVGALQAAASHYAALHDTEGQDDAGRADACYRLGSLLAEADRLPEAMQAWQEAADAFGRLAGGEALAAECAQRIVQGGRELRRRPAERLYLLIARMEREQRQLAEAPDSDAAQADIAFRIGTIFQRRDRFEEAAERYHEALVLYERAPECEIAQAECHQRLAGLYHHELDDREAAARHYRAAIALYTDFEEPSDGEQMNRALCQELLAGLYAA